MRMTRRWVQWMNKEFSYNCIKVKMSFLQRNGADLRIEVIRNESIVIMANRNWIIILKIHHQIKKINIKIIFKDRMILVILKLYLKMRVKAPLFWGWKRKIWIQKVDMQSLKVDKAKVFQLQQVSPLNKEMKMIQSIRVFQKYKTTN